MEEGFVIPHSAFGMNFLILYGLRKVYPDGTEAVKGIDLSVEEGEFIVLLGPSGCGKTTTLRMIAGLEVPTGGQVVMAGRDVTYLRPSERDVGFVFQFYALYPHMTVEKNIAFPLESIGMPRWEREKVVVETIRRLGIKHLLGLYPRQLSGGDQQRVALARAMVRRPRLYLMDEPLGTLDEDQRLEMREFIRSHQLEMKVTTIYVTHDQEEAMNLADRIVVMEAGTICQAGTPEEVYDRPANLFVAHFVGSPGMNFIEGEIIAREGTSLFMLGNGKTSLRLEREVRPGKATLGIRSEYIHPDPDGILTGVVVMDEYMGSFRSLHVDTEFGRLAVRLAGDGAADRTSKLMVTGKRQIGEMVRLGFDPAHTRLFDSETRKSL